MAASMGPSRQVLVFFALACALTALCQAPAILALRAGEQPTGIALPLMVIGASGPTLVALCMALLLEGRAGVRALFRRGIATAHRVPLALVALAHPFVAHMIGSGVLLAVGQYTAQNLVHLPLKPEQIAIAIIAPLGEEYGWRGYALPRLQRVTTPVVASAIIGVVWALWHVPSMFMPGATLHTLWLFLPLMIAGSLIYTWLFNTSRGSMLVVVLAHLGIHLDNIARAEMMGDGWAPAISTSVVLVVFAAVLVATGRLAASRAVTT